MVLFPIKAVNRSPLKETDANLRGTPLNENGKESQLLPSQEKNDNNKYTHNDNDDGTHNKSYNTPNTQNNNNALFVKKRLIERSEQQQKKKPRVERARSIEGAVLVSKPAALKNVQNKVTPKELLEWQNNWKKILRRDSRIYFDTTEDGVDNIKTKKTLDKKRDLLKKGFLSLGAEITQFFDTSVTIVVTARSTENIHLLNDKDILPRAKKNFMKVWGYEKAFRFLTNLDVDFNALIKNKSPIIATPTLSHLLENEKLYGPTDRDPRTKRDDIHYFKHSYIYMYDIWQTWAPIITLEWRQQDLADENNLPYPTLKMGTFGRCPFVGDRYCVENSAKRILKRYKRDQINLPYALKLRQLYQYHAIPSKSDCDAVTKGLIFLPHTCQDSTLMYQKLIKGSEHNHLSTNTRILTETKITVNEISKLNSINNDNSNINVDTGTKLVQTVEKNDRGEDTQVSLMEIPNPNDPANNESALQIYENIKKNDDNSLDKGKVVEKTWKEPISIPSLKNTPLIPLVRQETEDLPDDLCATLKRQSRVPFEIKASGAHQSNDVATSFGNGLGPTKSTVMSKNIRTLNKLVDRKLDGPVKRYSNSNVEASYSRNSRNTVNGVAPLLSRGGSNLKNSFGRESICKEDNNQQQKKVSGQTGDKDDKSVIKKQPVKNSGYCENCRVKYESLDEHVLSEKHLNFANNDLNFEAIDCLIDKLDFQF